MRPRKFGIRSVLFVFSPRGNRWYSTCIHSYYLGMCDEYVALLYDNVAESFELLMNAGDAHAKIDSSCKTCELCALLAG